MNKTDSDKSEDTGILRAKDIIPPYTNINKKPKQHLKKENSLRTEHKAKHTELPPSKSKNTASQNAEIPKFDLAEHILSEQRKTASVRRKGPGAAYKNQNSERRIRSISYNILKQPKLAQQEQIIAEIVSRDIQKLCNGDNQDLNHHIM